MTNSPDACTTIIHRSEAAIPTLREVIDHAASVRVIAFPFTDAAIIGARGLPSAGAYVLAGGDTAYIGESGSLPRRFTDHAADPTKSFAADVYVITTVDGRRLEKPALLYLQARLTASAEAAGYFRIQRGASPCSQELEPWCQAPLDRMLADSCRLLYDAGCRVFHASDAKAHVRTATQPDSDDEAGTLEIGVSTVPLGVLECELAYSDLWARGYDYQGAFIVAAGSEMRKSHNASLTSTTVRAFRQFVIDNGGVAEIPNVKDRVRLTRPMRFDKMALAAKVVSGAHIGSASWRPLPPAKPVVLGRSEPFGSR